MKFYLFDKKNIHQIICAFIISLPVFSYGNSLGWMSPMTLLLQSDHSPAGDPLTDVQISWMAAVPYLTGIPFYYILAYMGDKYGRKNTMLFTTALGSCIWILKLLSTNFWAFVVARGLVGVLMAGSFVTCPVYIKEISENSIRGHLGCWTSVFYTSGSLFTYIIGDMLSYKMILFVCLGVSAFSFFLFLTMPESPSYYVQIGEIEKAQKTLLYLRKKPEIDDAIRQEIETISTEQKNDNTKDENILKSLFTDNILFRAFQIALMTALGREVCGAVPVLNFAGDIFLQASEGAKLLHLNANQQAMILGAVQSFASIVASSIVDKSGRRPLLFITCLVSGVSMCTLATWFLLKFNGIHAPAWIPIVTMCICIFCDSAGLLPLGTVVTGEIFSFKYRGTVLATTMAIASVVDFLQVFFFMIMAAAIGLEVAFFIFGVFCLFVAAYVIIRVPETKERSLEEIYDDLRTKKEKLAIEDGKTAL